MIARISKAIAGAIVAGFGVLVGAWPDGVTAEEWGKVAAAVVVGGIAVWSAPRNAPPKGFVTVPSASLVDGTFPKSVG